MRYKTKAGEWRTITIATKSYEQKYDSSPHKADLNE